jgi:hypothetical protein
MIVREQVVPGQIDMNSPASPLDRLKVLINSSTPIVVMETIEELRAVRMVRVACTDLNLATFEWTIASGLARSGTNSTELQFESALPPGGNEGLAPCVLWIDELEKFSLEAGPIPLRPMRAFHRDCWRHFFPGCRSASPPSL